MLMSISQIHGYISIHAPTRGATGLDGYCDSSTKISIHAPTRGATNRTGMVLRHPGNFNPRSHKGSDFIGRRNGDITGDFNPRSHKGSDVYTNTVIVRVRDFNPRSHKGSDSNFTQNSISVLFHFYQSFPHIIFPHTARFRLLIIFCTFFLVRIAQRFPVCFHFAPKQYPAFYNVCSTDLL